MNNPLDPAYYGCDRCGGEGAGPTAPDQVIRFAMDLEPHRVSGILVDLAARIIRESLQQSQEAAEPVRDCVVESPIPQTLEIVVHSSWAERQEYDQQLANFSEPIGDYPIREPEMPAPSPYSYEPAHPRYPGPYSPKPEDWDMGSGGYY